MGFFNNIQLIVCFFAVVVSKNFCAASAAHFSTQGFLGPQAGPIEISTQTVQSSLQTSLNEVLAGGDGSAVKRLSAIEASLWHTFQALPKNSHGRLAPRAVRYLVHAYFAKEHGWLIQGLEAHTVRMNGTTVHEVSILQDKVPGLVEGLLEARQQQRGLSFSDSVAMVAALERLIFYESISLLDIAYALNGKSVTDSLDSKWVHEVLMSYLLLFEQGLSASNIQVSPADAEKHQAFKARAAQEQVATWQELSEFAWDTTMNLDYAQRHAKNPFMQRSYSFEMVAEIIQAMAEMYGKWQNSECMRMKDELLGMDAEGNGRIPLSKFYSTPSGASYTFAESASYLRQIGALEESSTGSPHVIIPNYVAGPTNCIASSTYYSVCCLSECEGLMSELESRIQGPVAPPERLLALIANMSSSSIDAPRVLPEALVKKMHALAARHNGEVPLHSRLFAQWLHYAFPAECPYPHLVTDAAALSPSQWGSDKATATQEEVDEHKQAASAPQHSVSAAASMIGWTDEEVLILEHALEEPKQLFLGIMRLAVMGAVLLLVLRVALTHCQSALDTAKEEFIWRSAALRRLRSGQDGSTMEVDKLAI